MALIIPTESAKKRGLLHIQKFDPIDYDGFEKRKKAYKDHNKKIGDRRNIDLSKEPIVVYFNRADVLTILKGNPTYLTFMFACADNPKHDGLRVILCGMDVPGVPIPISDEKIFEGYEKGGRSKKISKTDLDIARDLFVNRLSFFEDSTNWRGVKNDIKKFAPDPLIKLIEEDETINRIAVYLAVVPADLTSSDVFDHHDHYGVMVALSEKDFHDLVPTADSGENGFRAYDNGTQCCQ